MIQHKNGYVTNKVRQFILNPVLLFKHLKKKSRLNVHLKCLKMEFAVTLINQYNITAVA